MTAIEYLVGSSWDSDPCFSVGKDPCQVQNRGEFEEFGGLDQEGSAADPAVRSAHFDPNSRDFDRD